MPYTGTDADLIDLQNQINDNKQDADTKIAGLQTQIKQVTLQLESELTVTNNAFVALKTFIQKGGGIISVNGVSFVSGTSDPTTGSGVAAALPAIYVRTTNGTVWYKTPGGSTAWVMLT